MQKIRVSALMMKPWIISTSSWNRALCSGIARDWWLVDPLSLALPTATVRSIHCSQATSTITAKEKKPGFFIRMMRKIDGGKYRRRMIAHFLYEDIVKNINYSKFFKDFNLPDTFNSWFVIMELHVWMLLIRYMAEGVSGHEIRNNIVEVMWIDVTNRQNKLKNVNMTALRRQKVEMSQQFNAAIIGYDEGITSDDKILAAAVWRRFYHCECNNPLLIEKLVMYVRKQVSILENMSSEEFQSRQSIQWIDYENH